MAFLLEEVQDFYNRTMENGDERVAGWMFMQSPLPTLAICLFYVFFVKVLGPAYMKNRQPFNIRALMIIYNFSMVAISLALFVLLGIHGWFGKYSWKCQPIDYTDSDDALFMVNAAWWYYFSKYVEFADTIFFVLRKKFSHVSTLHVIHHGVMPMSVWWGVKFTPGGHSTFFAFVNSFVHVLMYFYYGLAAIGPHMNKYLWWKKYMTAFQMVQFVMIFIHSFQLLFIECNYPRGFMWWIGFHAIMFWFLFWDFFQASYNPVFKRKQANGKVSNGSRPSNGSCGALANGSATKGALSNGSALSFEANGEAKRNGYKNGVSTNGLTLRSVAKPSETE